MTTSLTGRSFLRELEFTVQEWRTLLDLSVLLETEHRTGTERQRLTGANIAVIFEKASTRDLQRHDFPSGSMRPKVEAVSRSVTASRARAAIGSLDEVLAVFAGTAGIQVRT
jgi:hypothetical protein